MVEVQLLQFFRQSNVWFCCDVMLWNVRWVMWDCVYYASKWLDDHAPDVVLPDDMLDAASGSGRHSRTGSLGVIHDISCAGICVSLNRAAGCRILARLHTVAIFLLRNPAHPAL